MIKTITGLFLITCTIVFLLVNNIRTDRRCTGKYYLSIPPRPNNKAWLEIDYISHDTAYCNWYWKQ